MMCDILPNEPAVWTYSRKKVRVKLSNKAAEALGDGLKVDGKKLELHESKPIFIDPHYYDPVSSMASAFMSAQVDILKASAGIVYQPYKEYMKADQESRARSETNSHADTASTKVLSLDDNGEGSSRDGGARLQKGESSNVGGKMAVASAKSLGDVCVKGVKGLAVDIPLACAQGFQNVPTWYGDEARDYGRVTDWKSGAVAGGKSFMYGMGEGLTDIFVQPYAGAQKEGTLGAVKGVGKGTVSLVTKTASGLLGLVAYPGQGLSKSIRTAVKSTTRKNIIKARRTESEFLMQAGGEKEIDREWIMRRFDELMRG